ncbi:MAG: hypothetical protein ABEJ30_04375 [Halorientalis sp.]
MRSRLATALLGVVLSVCVSVAAWVFFDTLLLLLVLPLVPLLFRRGDAEERRTPVRSCPACGYRTRDPAFDYCPRDGTPLE